MTRTRVSLALAALAGALLTPVAASAAPASTVDITVTADGFSAPDAVAPGAATLAVSTSDPEGAWIGLVRLRSGVALDTYLADLTTAFADGPDAGAAARRVEQEVVAHGGLAVLNGRSATSSQYLTPGTYHLIDYKEVGRPGPAATVRELRVSGRWNAPAPSASAHVVMYSTMDGARFAAPTQLGAGEPLRVTNLSRQLNEAILMPLRDGLDGEDVREWFGDMGSAYPFTGDPSGMVVLSPGLTQVVDLNLPAGGYALVSWAHDYETGEFHTARGMVAVVEIG